MGRRCCNVFKEGREVAKLIIETLENKAFFSREKEFKFLIATEAYEVGVHNDHVNNVCRIGTPRNLTVLLQEFGRAGRLGDVANGM